MVSLYTLKPAFQKMLHPACRGLQLIGVHPNQVTVAAASLALVFGACLAMFPNERWLLGLMPLVLIVRMALNALDGLLAEASGLRSKRGAILNEVGDAISDVALYLPLAWIRGFSALPILVCVTLILACEWQGIAAVRADRQPRREGPMGKSDRAFAFGLLSLLVWLHLLPPPAVGACVWGIAALVIVTRIQRGRIV